MCLYAEKSREKVSENCSLTHGFGWSQCEFSHGPAISIPHTFSRARYGKGNPATFPGESPDYNRDVSPPDYNRDVSPPDYNRDVSPPDYNRDVSPPDYNRDVSPPDYNRDVSPPDYNRDVSPPDYNRDVSPPDYNRDVSPPDYNRDVSRGTANTPRCPVNMTTQPEAEITSST
ncbi:uncharacterized protein [Branchiostoma lanceolatum]|uniref:uncharacterized protein n=1 Tax=Branchiostoma lanceolatum TaxID=7740 RepID=UPI00345111A7